MQVEIKVVLDQEDLDKGLTAQEAVEKAFPQAASAEVAPIEAPIEEVLESIEELDKKPADNTAADVDSAGIPWIAELHNGNRKKYASGPDEGRWQWKRGSDPATREQQARDFAGLPPVAPVVEAPAITVPVVAPEVAPPAAPPAAPVAPPGLGMPPGITQGAVDADEPAGDIPVDWIDFCKALPAAGLQFSDVQDLMLARGIEDVPQLATDENKPARDEIARELGLVTQR